MTEEQRPRGYRSRHDRRTELLDAAALVVRNDGLRGLTTRAVAARAGVAHGVVHYAFGARRNLVIGLLERQARAVLPPVLAAADEHDDLAAALEAGISAYLDLVRREPERFRVLEALSATALAPDGDGDLLDAERGLWHDGVVAGIERWTARHGATPSEPVPVVADAVITLVDGLARAAWSDPDGTATAQSRALLVRGLTTAVAAEH